MFKTIEENDKTIKNMGLTQKEYNQLEAIFKKANVGQLQYIKDSMLNTLIEKRLKQWNKK